MPGDKLNQCQYLYELHIWLGLEFNVFDENPNDTPEEILQIPFKNEVCHWLKFIDKTKQIKPIHMKLSALK